MFLFSDEYHEMQEARQMRSRSEIIAKLAEYGSLIATTAHCRTNKAHCA
jgi:hypothetical protein